MTAQRIDQGMAVAAARALPDPVTRELRSRYRQLQAMMHRAGLAATYAFIADGMTKNGKLADAYSDAGKAIREQIFPPGHSAREGSAKEVMKELGEMEPADYARASAKASAFAGWLSRLADAMFQESAGPDETDDGTRDD